MKTFFSTSAANYGLPRTVSGGLKLRLLFGNVLAMMGLFFFLFGLVMASVFGALSDFGGGSYNSKARGTITQVEETSSRENKKDIFCYSYIFKASDGREYADQSYYPEPPMLAQGDTVTIEYDASGPVTSRIAGMRTAPFGGGTAFIFIFPFVGLIILVIGLFRGKKNLKLVTHGYLTTGKVLRREPTNTRINNRTVYKVYFEFKGPDGSRQEAMVRTHRVERVIDEAEEKLVFDINDPEKAVLVDALPGAVKKFFEATGF